jgi:hypothetical protein
MQVKARGYRVVFDYANVVRHYPTNSAYTSGRGGDLRIKLENAAWNQGFVLARHSPAHLRASRLAYLLLVGSVATPGLLALPVGVLRHGAIGRELELLGRSLRATWGGWRDGSRAPGPPPRRASGPAAADAGPGSLRSSGCRSVS